MYTCPAPTFVDHLLEPEAGKTEGHRYSLVETRRDTDAALAQYGGLLTTPERAPFEALTDALASYWNVLGPVFDWTPQQRKRDGFLFLQDEVFRRRIAMLGIADQIRAFRTLPAKARHSSVRRSARC